MLLLVVVFLPGVPARARRLPLHGALRLLRHGHDPRRHGAAPCAAGCRRSEQYHRFSHVSDWTFLVLLFLTALSGILLHVVPAARHAVADLRALRRAPDDRGADARRRGAVREVEPPGVPAGRPVPGRRPRGRAGQAAGAGPGAAPRARGAPDDAADGPRARPRSSWASATLSATTTRSGCARPRRSPACSRPTRCPASRVAISTRAGLELVDLLTGAARASSSTAWPRPNPTRAGFTASPSTTSPAPRGSSARTTCRSPTRSRSPGPPACPCRRRSTSTPSRSGTSTGSKRGSHPTSHARFRRSRGASIGTVSRGGSRAG